MAIILHSEPFTQAISFHPEMKIIISHPMKIEFANGNCNMFSKFTLHYKKQWNSGTPLQLGIHEIQAIGMLGALELWQDKDVTRLLSCALGGKSDFSESMLMIQFPMKLGEEGISGE